MLPPMALLSENVQSFPRPPALEPVAQRICVHLAGALVVESNNALRVLETHHAPTYYVPRRDVLAVLKPASGASFCEWKGTAQYWSVDMGDTHVNRAAWSYPDPIAPYAEIKDHVAFYAGKVDACYVGEERVMPQPGDFYGGWVTSNLTGRIKGGPGTRHW